MDKETIHISSECNLSLSLNRLKIKYKEGTLLYRPLDDIFSLVVDNRIATITVPLLNALSEAGITVIFCDERHMPVSVLQRLDGNYLHSGRTRYQLNASIPMQKQLWKQIVFSKIQNQSNLLTLLNIGDDPLKTYYSNVKSGDSTNRESLAARIYWKKLFGKEFTRDRYGNPPNNMLNYGYAILRAYVARALIGRGLLLEIGIFHKNRFDPMPLADDMMEPFRPFVDEVVWHLYKAGKCDIDKDFKYAIMEIFYRRLQFETLVDMADSLVRIYCGEAGTLIFKSICQ